MFLAALFIIVKTGNNANFHDTWLGKTICDITIKWNTTHKMECNSDIYTQQLEWISKILHWAETWLKNTNTKKKTQKLKYRSYDIIEKPKLITVTKDTLVVPEWVSGLGLEGRNGQ